MVLLLHGCESFSIWKSIPNILYSIFFRRLCKRFKSSVRIKLLSIWHYHGISILKSFACCFFVASLFILQSDCLHFHCFVCLFCFVSFFFPICHVCVRFMHEYDMSINILFLSPNLSFGCLAISVHSNYETSDMLWDYAKKNNSSTTRQSARSTHILWALFTFSKSYFKQNVILRTYLSLFASPSIILYISMIFFRFRLNNLDKPHHTLHA